MYPNERGEVGPISYSPAGSMRENVAVASALLDLLDVLRVLLEYLFGVSDVLTIGAGGLDALGVCAPLSLCVN